MTPNYMEEEQLKLRCNRFKSSEWVVATVIYPCLMVLFHLNNVGLGGS